MKAGCKPVQLAIPAKYAGQFKISDAAVGEDDESNRAQHLAQKYQ